MPIPDTKKGGECCALLSLSDLLGSCCVRAMSSHEILSHTTHGTRPAGKLRILFKVTFISLTNKPLKGFYKR
jgi:hypothetical protein